ncbi:MAG: molybdopterin-synthase adenylyltransferase MoeB [Candidatus Wallbacteria bacterium]|nr:molybdopterin-synthase adenylyltransferase MoeB [Candidatus Wallbacteria bacterium]
MPAAALSHEEILRYSRHLLMPEVGVAGQLKLKSASVLIVGAGGLGAPLGLYLAAAGVGRLGLVDCDRIDATNLHRQVLYTSEDVGKPKLAVAAQRLRGVNPHVDLRLHETRLTSENAEEIARDYDIVADGTDNFATRYLVNDLCVLLGKPNVYGSIYRFEGQASVFDARRGPCYRCLYPQPPPPGLVPSCAEGGVLGILPGIIGLIQATETVKLILEQGEPLIGRLLLFDALGMSFRELRLEKSPACPVCGTHPTIDRLLDYEVFCGGAPEPAAGAEAGTLTAPELKAELDAGRPVRLVDVREAHEFEICRIEGATLLPLSQLPERMSSLAAADEIVVYCHHGMRSRKALDVLTGAGFKKLRHLSGGIDAWSRLVDPSVPRY